MFPDFDPTEPLLSLARQLSLTQIALTAVLTKVDDHTFFEFVTAMNAAPAEDPALRAGATAWVERLLRSRSG